MKLHTKHFSELDVITFFKIAKARVDIFVVEQNCAYPELDEVDQDVNTRHIYALDDEGQIAMYARCYPKGSDCIAIGRVIVSQSHRGKGYAILLMQECLANCDAVWPDKNIELSAQTHLISFYESLGFEQTSDSYLEDGIPHTDMKLNKKASS